MKTMKLKNMEIEFQVTNYADMFERKAVIAWIIGEGKERELYGDVTINIPQYYLDEDECFISADCPNLVKEMVKQGYLKILDEIKVNLGTYKIGKFTKKFVDEFE